ncbi:pyruvate, water dikinase regulatory protein [Lactobacillus sp. Sy-1]|uniref:pyruvate, water dikinase regulatory protein n=1 Tax=Lactobacillus sp. Sy-1 TaxID=2109645 RepID=UPI001C590E86|nr:pyruvate, water dikinase regulatory protein [Lactobacillus sp. Sy-1]MBW1605518.1 kinase/pyrophosphorylase [Lactobacillus sp. Sy-1]
MKNINVFIISDSSGETAFSVARIAVSQFPDVKVNYQRFPFIQTKSILTGILKMALENNAIIFHTLVNEELSSMIRTFAAQNNLYNSDCLQNALSVVSERTGDTPVRVPGLVHDLNDKYFDRIAAMEFAVANDDGKNPSDLTKADIVILGVSRTSKTPLSLYLANKNLKVANIPIAPNTQLPDQIWDVDPNRIFGLTNTPKALKKIRRARMIAYGLSPDTPYSDPENIKAELQYAKDLYKKLGCLVINVFNKSIEETATIIMESLNLDTNNRH